MAFTCVSRTLQNGNDGGSFFDTEQATTVFL
jgi:hypothetical protein